MKKQAYQYFNLTFEISYSEFIKQEDGTEEMSDRLRV